MTPQSHFMVIAALAPQREAALRQLLDTMTAAGMADPRNAILPFGDFGVLHFARLVLLADATLADVTVYGLPAADPPLYLAFMGDCDGPAADFLAAAAQRCGPGLKQVFSHCTGFDANGDVLAWMLAHDQPVAASYVNRVGRTVLQIREEAALAQALSARVPRDPPASADAARQRRLDLIAFVAAEVRAGRLSLTPPPPTPLGWQIARLGDAIAVPLLALALTPLFIVLLPVLLLQLRAHETSDPEICPRPAPAALRALQVLEDMDVTNQYTAIGTLKPGVFRRWLVTVLLVGIEYFCRHVFTRGYLARVQTIHFARWAFLDGKSRVVFASSYDGGHEAYMDDFINKVSWGLNLVFSSGIGWPHTNWLIARGARREHQFKYFQRRHQIPTHVWYKAYPGLTLFDLDRNQRIRRGLERRSPSDEQVVAWLRLL